MIITKNIIDNATLFFDLGAQHSPSVISVVGAGGKTSTIFWLAQLFLSRGRRVLVTTTTHMFLPDLTYPVLFCRDPAALPAQYLKQPILICFHSWKAAEGKARGFPPHSIDVLAARGECDVILVEADGAHGLPLKAPDEHEPCIPDRSGCVIAVTGGHMLGEKTGVANVHRWPLFAGITGLAADEPLAFRHLVRLIQHPQGAFKGTPSISRRIWLLNQISHFENSDAESELIPLLCKGDVDAIWLGSVQGSPAITHRLVR